MEWYASHNVTDEWCKYNDFTVFLVFFIIRVIKMTSLINSLPVPEWWKHIPRQATNRCHGMSRDTPPFPYFQMSRQSPILITSCTCIVFTTKISCVYLLPTFYYGPSHSDLRPTHTFVTAVIDLSTQNVVAICK